MDILFYCLNLEVSRVCWGSPPFPGKASPNQAFYCLEFPANFILVWQLKLFSVKLTKYAKLISHPACTFSPL